MKALPVLFTASLRGLSTATPAVAAELAYRLFTFRSRPAPVHRSDRETHAAARVNYVVVHGRRVAVYRWGTGGRKALLVHGWGRRASELGAIVRTLQSSERTVIAFDGPGHGASRGAHTSIVEFTKTIRALDRVEGGFDLIIAHSMGVLATFSALRQRAQTRAVAAIAGPFDMDYILSVISRTLQLTDRAAARLRSKIERRFLHADIRQWASAAPPDAGDMPLLIIHDRDDNDIDRGQADLIARAHTASTRTIMTSGLGHYAILADQEVLQHLRGFAAEVDERSRPSMELNCEDTMTHLHASP